MGKPSTPQPFRQLSPEALLGPLNEVERHEAPEALYVSGRVEVLKSGPCVSVVGTRKASADGLKRAKKLARLLVDRGATVVSGLAEGIDTAAHLSAIEAGGRTVAVLGTPLDKVYPRKNAELQRRIMEEFLAVSQLL